MAVLQDSVEKSNSFSTSIDVGGHCAFVALAVQRKVSHSRSCALAKNTDLPTAFQRGSNCASGEAGGQKARHNGMCLAELNHTSRD